MKLFKRVAIIGVGLIGGSLALAMRKKGLAEEIVGVSRHAKTLRLARKRGVINKGSLKLNIVKDADLVIFAAPVKTILAIAKKVSRLVKNDCLVTDVGSTKQEIVVKLEKLFPAYVGAHPLAGSQKRGVMNARADLFKNSLCILTPTKDTKARAQKRIEKLWRACGARVILLSSAQHDKALSFVSHLPHIVAFSLIGIVPREYLKFAASGLKDTTRIAASDSEIWADIFFSNQELLKAIESLEQRLSRIKRAIKHKDRKTLEKILQAARQKREILG